MAEPVPGRWRKRCRRCLRALRISFVLLVFFVVAAGVYLNEVGLPGFLKTPLLRNLHERGLDLQFSRLRWHLNRGFVAEDVHFESAKAKASDPEFSAREVALKVDHGALLKWQWTLDSLMLRNGTLTWPVGGTNEKPLSLSATNIQAQLRFLPGDRWELDHLTAAFAGGKLHFSGSVTNATALRDWKFFHGGGTPTGTSRRLRDLAETLERIKFRVPPELFVTLGGDARDPQSFQGLLTLKAEDAETPWGGMTNGTLVTRLNPGEGTNQVSSIAVELRMGTAATPWGSLTNGLLMAKLNAPDITNYAATIAFELKAQEAGTPWVSGQNFRLKLNAARDERLTNIVRADLEIQADRNRTEWAKAGSAQMSIHWTHSLTNAIPLDGDAKLRLTGIDTRWANAGELELTAQMATPPAAGSLQADASWGWWSKLEPYALDWTCHLKDIRSQEIASPDVEEFALKELDCGGNWRAPQLAVTNLSAELYGGKFSVEADLNVATRVVMFSASSGFDVQRIAPFLPEESRNWLGQFSWEQPPQASCTGGVTLPAWTNRAPDWDAEVMPTLWMQGEFKAGNAAFKQIPVTSAQSHFSLTNVVWDLPDIVALRPEGRLELEHRSDDRSHLFYFHIHSGIDPKAMRPLLSADGQQGMDEFSFSVPPKVDAELWGRWRDNKSIGFKAHVELTNVTFRGETATRVEGDLVYTNQFMNVFNGRIERGKQYMTATGLGVDFPGQRLFLTNGFSTMEAMPVAHAISKKVTRTIEPYQFLQLPTVHAHGTIPLVDEVPADLHFQVEGGPFHWMKFNLDHVAAEVNWVGDHMTVTNAKAAFYKGNLEGAAAFNFAVEPGTDFAFDLAVTNADLNALIKDLRTASNHLEGLFGGHLKITHANSDDWKSWNGSGDVSLRDGLIWDIPVFGRFSHFLDDIHAGMGESRAKEGSGRFTISNSVIHSDSLEIRSPAFRLLYHGNVDFDGKVDSRMEAEVFRDAPLVGAIISTVLFPLTKFFESKVGGTLDDPKIEPRFTAAKALLAPFHPFRTIGEMFPSNNTNTAPAFQDLPAPAPAATNTPSITNAVPAVPAPGPAPKNPQP